MLRGHGHGVLCGLGVYPEKIIDAPPAFTNILINVGVFLFCFSLKVLVVAQRKCHSTVFVIKSVGKGDN